MEQAQILINEASDLQFKQKNYVQAYQKYKEIVEKYPGTNYARTAQQMMNGLEKEGLNTQEACEKSLQEEAQEKEREKEIKEKVNQVRERLRKRQNSDLVFKITGVRGALNSDLSV